MILNELGQHADDLRVLVPERPWASAMIADDCHPVSHSASRAEASQSRRLCIPLSLVAYQTSK